MRSCYLLVLLMAGSIAAEEQLQKPTRVRFSERTIDANPPDRPYYKMVGDLDGDGDLDVVVGGRNGPLVMYTAPSWKKQHLADSGWNGVNGEIVDLDADGDLDIVMCGIVWFSNPRLGGGHWDLHRIDRRRAHDIEVGDLNRDGHMDVVARDQSAFGRSGQRGGNAIFIYYQTGREAWSRHSIDCPHGEGLRLGDMDRDGDIDVVTGARWYENTDASRPADWPAHLFSQAWTEADTKVEIADMNGDGRVDVVLTPAELQGETYKIAWYEAPKNPKQPHWQEHVIVPQIECVIHSLGVGDLDNDGDNDVAIAEMDQGKDPDEVSILLSANQGTSWRKQVLSTKGSHDIVVADIGEDGDLDIVGANHARQHPLQLWENQLNPKPSGQRTR